MIENIALKDFPQKSGVYCFVNMNDEVIYVGSTKNIYDRMRGHRCNIKRGCNGTNSPKEQKNLYKFLQNNEFKVNFQIVENYTDLEKQFIEKYKPIFNELYTPFSEKEKMLMRKKRQNKSRWQHREKRNKLVYEYLHQICLYNGEKITLQNLGARFRNRGIPYPYVEAKKYLIENKMSN